MTIKDSDISALKSSAGWRRLQRDLRREIARRSPDSLLDWSLAHRTFGGQPMRLIPAMKDLYRDRHSMIVVQKAAQVFISEWLVNTALWVADTGQGGRGNALYVMPTQGHVEDFSQARVDRAITESPYLVERAQPPPGGKAAARKGLKRIGQGHVYLRGSENRRQMISVDADAVLLDEFDEMKDGVLELARKRLASSRLGLLRVASTPRYPETGINGLFLASDRRYYFLPCPHCGLKQRLEWEENVDQDRAMVVCRRCREPINLEARGEWVATFPGNSDIHGYHINRLYSPRANIRDMIAASRAETHHALMEFYNSDLGEVYSPPGGGLSYGDLDLCRLDEEARPGGDGRAYMGVDVGNKLHVVVRRQMEDGRSFAAYIGMVNDFEKLDQLMHEYEVQACVVDGQPDTRKAREFQGRFRGQVWLARYSNSSVSATGCDWENGSEARVDIERTVMLDETFERFRRKQSLLPGNARSLIGEVRHGVGEYYREMTALRRVIEDDSNGNQVARYENSGADHFAHAELYCLAAGRRPVGTMLVGDASDFVAAAEGKAGPSSEGDEELDEIERKSREMIAKYGRSWGRGRW